jgi:GntR family transcriptional regulator
MLDEASPMPLYAQIIARIRHAIAIREMAPGEQLPTVRQLAVDLCVNPNTVARAYDELERAGVIETRRGRGTFVSTAGASERASETPWRLSLIVQDAVAQAEAIGSSALDLADAMADYVRRRK